MRIADAVLLFEVRPQVLHRNGRVFNEDVGPRVHRQSFKRGFFQRVVSWRSVFRSGVVRIVRPVAVVTSIHTYSWP